jgi:hypothetical protein
VCNFEHELPQRLLQLLGDSSMRVAVCDWGRNNARKLSETFDITPNTGLNCQLINLQLVRAAASRSVFGSVRAFPDTIDDRACPCPHSEQVALHQGYKNRGLADMAQALLSPRCVKGSARITVSKWAVLAAQLSGKQIKVRTQVSRC